jgi:hypothetical protein
MGVKDGAMDQKLETPLTTVAPRCGWISPFG